MNVQSYLFFDGRCEEALEFYKRTLGAEVMRVMRFGDNPEGHEHGTVAPGSENKVMHCAFRIGDTELMASDGENKGHPSFQGFSLSVSVPSDADAKQRFDALAEGGRVTMPLTKTFFSSNFGMVTDRFGMHWMVIVDH
jgi:PhnB protein